MPESACRLSVQTDGETTDLVLPAGTTVDSLLPDIVTLAGPDTSGDGVSWRLDQLSGKPINGALSLAQNGVHDGDVLQLRSLTAPALGPVRRHTVAMAAGSVAPDPWRVAVPLVLGIWMLAAAGVMLAWSGTHGDQLAAVAISIGTALFTIIAALRADRETSAGLRVAAIVSAGAAGFTVVPTRPSAPNILLASAAVLAVSLILLRTGKDLISTAAASLSVPMLAAAGLASFSHLPAAGSGTAVAVTALAVLTAAPRCAVAIAGLTPDSASPEDGDDRRIDLAHRMLTGMVIGAAASCAVGAGAVAARAADHAGAATVVFSWALAAAMMLRAPSYRLPVRRCAVLAAGLVCTTTALAVTGMRFPGQVSWLGLGAVAIGLAALRIELPSVASVRRLAYLEYAALATILPSALWVTDVYSLARGR